MKFFLTLLLVALITWGGWHFWSYINHKMSAMKAEERGESGPAPGKLPGMSAEMESSYEEAKRGGAETLARWLNRHRDQIRDPRLADIEMDYVVLVGRTNQAEARRVLDGIRLRVKPPSPAYRRFQQLDKAYH